MVWAQILTSVWTISKRGGAVEDDLNENTGRQFFQPKNNALHVFINTWGWGVNAMLTMSKLKQIVSRAGFP